MIPTVVHRASARSREYFRSSTKSGGAAPTRPERVETVRAVRSYTRRLADGGLVIRWGNLTEDEARRLVDLTRGRNRSTGKWWPLVLRGTGVRR